MQLKYGNTILSITALTLTIVVAILFFFNKPLHKTGFINIQEVYNDFEMKKELEIEYLNIESKRKAIIDSLKLASNYYYKQHSNTNLSNEVKQELLIRQKQIELKEKQFQEGNIALSAKYSEQVLKQINQYVFDYGKENNYDYIFGANSSGTLMYASDSKNLTKEMINFINNRYSGN